MNATPVFENKNRPFEHNFFFVDLVVENKAGFIIQILFIELFC